MAVIEDSFMLDLTNKGSRSAIDLRGVDKLSISTPMPGLMGSAVIELKRSVGGVLESFSPVRTLTSTVDGSLSANVNDIDEAVLEVTTPDSSAQDIVVNSFGETTRDGPVASGLGETGLFVLVESKDDLPYPVDGVVTLVDNATYYIVGTIDLEGDRLVGGVNTCIIGSTSENCILQSTGLTGTALITSSYSLPMRHLTVTADVGLALAGDGSTTTLDWYGVNFTNCGEIGTIEDQSNIIMAACAFLSSGGLVFDGTIGTVGISNSLLLGGNNTQDIISVPSTATITRRIRLSDCAVVVPTNDTGLDISSSATIPDESYILRNVDFSGSGTYLNGLDYASNTARFTSCDGITNTAEIAAFFMHVNTSATTISVSGTAVKVSGTTTASSVNQKFTHTSNRLTYSGALTRFFTLSGVASATSGNNKQIGVFFAKNGTVIAESEIYMTTNSGSRAESVAFQAIIQLATSDYIEVFVENATDTTNVTVTELIVTARGVA